jgi:HAD domain in Swiss Army Knife RNA repair proteins
VTHPAPADAPVWLLDVDGVVNARRPAWDQPFACGNAFVDGIAYRLQWAPALTRYIKAVHKRQAAEIRWATTWVDHVHQVERLLRLPAFRTAFHGLGAAPSVGAPDHKVAAALHVVEVERRPLIWTDDDAIPMLGSLRRRLEESGMPVLLIAPDSYEGLGPAHLERIDAFLAAVVDHAAS